MVLGIHSHDDHHTVRLDEIEQAKVVILAGTVPDVIEGLGFRGIGHAKNQIAVKLCTVAKIVHLPGLLRVLDPAFVSVDDPLLVPLGNLVLTVGPKVLDELGAFLIRIPANSQWIRELETLEGFEFFEGGDFAG